MDVLIIKPITIVFLVLFPLWAFAAPWEGSQDGEKRYLEVAKLVKKKEAPAIALEEVFRGRSQTLYTFKVNPESAFDHWYFTKEYVDYAVGVDVEYNRSVLNSFYNDIAKRREFKDGDIVVKIKFPAGTLALKIYTEHIRTFDRLIENGYRFIVNAGLLDKDQTVLTLSDNILETGTLLEGRNLDFTKGPYLISFEEVAESKGNWRKVDAKILLFRNLPIKDLKRMRTARVFKDDDELILYKADQ